MKLLGVPFSVKPSHAEEHHCPDMLCPILVKKNALLKAREVAGRVKEGIVVGADTLVTLGHGKIIGKPKSLKEAKKRLYTLSRNPSWVYTGVALIDAAAKEEIVDYEKTKVIMLPLSTQEIDRYYRHMSPMDKAGGFDIEGRGSHFIRRIDGCYFNVVGLPIAKLVAMLKKMGVHLMTLMMVLHLTGCSTQFNVATGRQETLLHTTESEVKIGNSVARRFEQEFKVIEDLDVNERVSGLLRRIVEVCDRQDLVYSVKVIDDDAVNAVSLPGGFIYVFRGLIEKVENEDQLACVIAHEVGHITARHAVKRIQTLYGYNLLQILSIQSGSADFARGVNLAFGSVFTAYSKEDEFEADRLGIKYAKKAGFDPNGMAGFLERLKEYQEKEPLRRLSYWRTHPYPSQRISQANQQVIGTLEFRDYLNLTGE